MDNYTFNNIKMYSNTGLIAKDLISVQPIDLPEGWYDGLVEASLRREAKYEIKVLKDEQATDVGNGEEGTHTSPNEPL